MKYAEAIMGHKGSKYIPSVKGGLKLDHWDGEKVDHFLVS